MSRPEYCSGCDTYHPQGEFCPPLDKGPKPVQPTKARSEYFRGAKISKPASRKPQS